jgi:hypothetical protein
VTYPLTAQGVFSVRDEASGLALSVRLVDAQPAPASIEEGYAVFEGALGEGVDVLHRPTLEGTEDYVRFERVPAEEVVRYRVEVPETAGLRQVGNVVEVLNEGGDPRLRVVSPWVLDGDGEGCGSSGARQKQHETLPLGLT